MGGGCNDIMSRLKGMQAPKCSGVLGIVLGIVNILLPGIGVIIAGAMNSDTTDILIGVIQLLTCWLIIGWVWAIVWGVLMIVRS